VAVETWRAVSLQQVSNQGNNRANALSGWRHIKLSMAASSGDDAWGRDVPWRIATDPSLGLLQATNIANPNTNPMKRCRFIAAKITKKKTKESKDLLLLPQIKT
jgi:hypothetical protein